MNVRFLYVYRDNDNYKNYGEAVFSGPELPGEEFSELLSRLDERLRAALRDGELFIAGDVGIPEVFLWDPQADYDPDDPEAWPSDLAPGKYRINEADHCWHEYVGLEAAEEPPTDPRTVLEFVQAVEQAAREGWKEFVPGERRRMTAPSVVRI